MNMKKPFQLYLDRRDQGLLAELAERHGLSMAETVREAVRRWAVEDAGTDDPVLGLIGSFDDTNVPSDLSTRHDDYAVEGYPARRVAEPDAGGRN
jgi:hypothetical protein